MVKLSALAGAVVVSAATFLAPPVSTEAAEPSPASISTLAGRWAGAGTVTPARGPAQAFKCVVTYISKGAQGDLQQNLRCQSADYRLDAATRLVINGSQVTGKWEDRIHSLSGDVYGLVTKDGFDIQLQGRFFQANMVVVSNDCQQSVKVTPVRADYIRELEASLRKC